MSWTPLNDNEKILFASILNDSMAKTLGAVAAMAAEQARLEGMPLQASDYGGTRTIRYPWQESGYIGDQETWIAGNAFGNAVATFLGFRYRAQTFVDHVGEDQDSQDAIVDFFGVTPTP